MNYTQKKKIEQITEDTLIVGVDVAKCKHVARAQDHRGIELGKRLVFENTREGLDIFKGWICLLQEEHNKIKVIVGVEPTGHYWFALAQYLRQAGITIVVVNPMHVKKSKELDDNSPTKNDTKDARVIAQLVKDGRYSEPNHLTGVYAELRIAVISRESLVKQMNQVKNQVINWLDRYFPEFTDVFKDFGGKAAMMTLQYFPLPQDIIQQGVDGIVKCWKVEIERGIGAKRAQILLTAAQDSIGLSEGLTMARIELVLLLSQYNLYKEQLDILEKEIKKLLKSIPVAVKMLTIPGIGWVTVAGFLAEVGDLMNYTHPQQIIKLAGLALKENSSGKHKGQTHITRRGRPRLRALLFRVVLVMVAKNNEFKQLHKYYTTRENPLKKKQSIVALCGKLIRVLFGMGRHQDEYDPAKVISIEIQNRLQPTA